MSELSGLLNGARVADVEYDSLINIIQGGSECGRVEAVCSVQGIGVNESTGTWNVGEQISESQGAPFFLFSNATIR